MSQYNWTLLDDFGNRYKVGIYHGDKTGHVLVYCNKKVVLIDFKVLRTKTYRFFLGMEFCELKVIKEFGSYRYDLKIDEKAKTHLNLHRQKMHRQNVIKSFVIFIVIVLTVTFLTYFFHYNY